MRSDMAKVIVERPRRGGGFRYPRAAATGRCGLEDLPRREGIGRPWANNSKWLNENLAPLRRYLRSQVGRPWDKVFAEVCQHMNRDSATQLHIWQHLKQEVCTDPHVIAGDVSRYTGTGFAGHLDELYVDPRTGLLRFNAAHDRRTWWRKQRPTRTVVRVDGRREYRKIDGSWWELTLVPLRANQYWADDVVFRKVAWPSPRADLVRFYGRAVYAVAKRSLNMEELMRLPRDCRW
jgi:hypothetical protein